MYIFEVRKANDDFGREKKSDCEEKDISIFFPKKTKGSHMKKWKSQKKA